MSRHGSNSCAECAGGSAETFRRTSSLRLRGERPTYPHRSQHGACPSIVEHPGSPVDDGPRSDARPRRQRSVSLSNSSGITTKKNSKPLSRTTPNSYMDPQASESDGHTPPGSPEDLPDDDSLHSYGSVVTTNSCDAGYAAFNGTTFSGRSMRYVLHCSSHAGLAGEDYLTPTQRAQKQIRRLKNLLVQAKRDLDKKDSDIFHLTKEVVELRLYKASLCSPDDKSNSSEIVTIREIPEDNVEPCETKLEEECSYDVADGASYKQTPTRSQNSDMQSSFTDSGHFEELTNTSVHSKDSVQIHDASCMTDVGEHEEERRKLIDYYEKKIEVLVRSHFSDTQDMKKSHNDKVETLLQRLAEVNTRYSELLPSHEACKERLHALERQLEQLSQQLEQEQAGHRDVYLQMYHKGLQAAQMNSDKEVSDGPVKRVSVSQLLEQLQITQTELDNVRAMYRRIVEAQGAGGGDARSRVDPEVTLQFLKSAVYYFLTDPDNHQGHLAAIESILGFSDAERLAIRSARAT